MAARRPILADAFDHHVWATLRLIDTCGARDRSRLETAVPGTYGSIIDTLRHLVGADTGYLQALTDGRRPRVNTTRMELDGLRTAMTANQAAWRGILAGTLDPDTLIVSRRRDGSTTRTTLGIRLAQALHHGTDHRSQVCTALTGLRVEPPAIDLWAFADEVGRVEETPPPA